MSSSSRQRGAGSGTVMAATLKINGKAYTYDEGYAELERQVRTGSKWSKSYLPSRFPDGKPGIECRDCHKVLSAANPSDSAASHAKACPGPAPGVTFPSSALYYLHGSPWSSMPRRGQPTQVSLRHSRQVRCKATSARLLGHCVRTLC